jgi:uracil-DNA glycosylase family 4
MSKLDELRKSIKLCTACGLRSGCTQVVPGCGAVDPSGKEIDPQDARILFVGEGPGANEDTAGRPFIGRSGNLLRESIKSSAIPDDFYYITNTVRCRPEDNRDPMPDEIEACWPWMVEVLKTLKKVKIIVPLGKPAVRTMAFKLGFQKQIGQLPITKIAGKPIYLEDRKLYVYPMFHPAFALRGYDRREEFVAHLRYLGKAYPGWLQRK